MAKTTQKVVSSHDFVTDQLPLYHGPCVKIKVRSCTFPKTEFIVSKDLLCAESPVFTQMLNGNFKEAQEQTIKLEEMEGVVTPEGVGRFIHWLYQGFIKGDEFPISAIIELARFADLYQITALESKVETDLKSRITLAAKYALGVNRNTHAIDSSDIISALNLPRGHGVRRVLAQASVSGFLQSNHYKFAELTATHPAYGADLLREVHQVLRGTHGITITFKDPILQESIRARRSLASASACGDL